MVNAKNALHAASMHLLGQATLDDAFIKPTNHHFDPTLGAQHRAALHAQHLAPSPAPTIIFDPANPTPEQLSRLAQDPAHQHRAALASRHRERIAQCAGDDEESAQIATLRAIARNEGLLPAHDLPAPLNDNIFGAWMHRITHMGAIDPKAGAMHRADLAKKYVKDRARQTAEAAHNRLEANRIQAGSYTLVLPQYLTHDFTLSDGFVSNPHERGARLLSDMERIGAAATSFLQTIGITPVPATHRFDAQDITSGSLLPTAASSLSALITPSLESFNLPQGMQRIVAEALATRAAFSGSLSVHPAPFVSDAYNHAVALVHAALDRGTPLTDLLPRLAQYPDPLISSSYVPDDTAIPPTSFSINHFAAVYGDVIPAQEKNAFFTEIAARASVNNTQALFLLQHLIEHPAHAIETLGYLPDTVLVPGNSLPHSIAALSKARSKLPPAQVSIVTAFESRLRAAAQRAALARSTAAA